MNKEYEIYYEAFDIEDAEERRAFILEKCGGDKEFYENIMKLFPDEVLDADRYGKYKIEREIGRGGMGIVYLAGYTETFENESLTRRVALKTLNPEQTIDAKSIKKLLLEIKTLAELEHPNIARFLDIGTSEKGKPFLVMEYIDGFSVNEYCDKNKLSIAERLSFFREILGAIEYSHRKGFIHCDIKPNNIIVDLHGTPKVIDFGIASKYGEFISDKHTHTTFFQSAFTPNYASPEQIKGEQNLSAATDIYSLGAVLYELLSGQLPVRFDGAASYQQLITTSETRYPPNLKKSVSSIDGEDERKKVASERDCKTIAELRDHLPNDLDEIVQKAISKKPSRRYRTVKEFDAEIGEFLSDESFFTQITRAFTSLYKKLARRLARIPMKKALAAGLVLSVLLAGLSQSRTVATVPYYLQLKFSGSDGQVRLGNSQTQVVDTSIERLKTALAKDLSEAAGQLNSGVVSEKHNVWGLSDLVVGLADADYTLDANFIDSIFNKSTAPEGCWKEEKVGCKLAVSGWVTLAKNRLNKPLLDSQLEFILKNQSSDGWFPAYPYPDKTENAATYPTAVVIMALTGQLHLNLISPDQKERVKTSIEKGAAWLLDTRGKTNGGFLWSDCPNNMPVSQTRSYGLDGMVIHALHTVDASGLLQINGLAEGLREIDSLWLANLTNMPAVSLEDSAECRCGTRSGDDVILDRTTQWSTPWSIVATVEAFPNGSIWQKATAKKWLEDLPISTEYQGYYYGASEYLIALSFLRVENISVNSSKVISIARA